MSADAPVVCATYSLTEVAALVGVDVRTIALKVRRGQFPKPLPHFRYRWPRVVIDAYCAGTWTPTAGLKFFQAHHGRRA